jgi:hypothetical protein
MYSFAHMSRPKDQLHTAVDPQLAAVQAEVIICRHSPHLVGDMLVVARTLFIPLLYMGLGGGDGNPMLCHYPAGPVGQHAGDKDMKAIFPPLEDVVGAPPYNDTGTLLRQFLNQFGLIGVDLIRQGHIPPLIGVIGRVAPR